MGLISKSNFARAAHCFCTFLCRCFAPLQREASRNFLVTRFMEEMSYVFPFSFFTAAHFHLAMVAASISHFVTATKFSRCSSNKKKCLLRFFISRSKSLSPFFSLSFAGLPPTFSCSIFQNCGHDNISKVNTLDNTDTETILAFRIGVRPGGAGGAAAPPNFGQLRFFGQHEKFGQS